MPVHPNIIFLGDGCGYLAKSLFELDKTRFIERVQLIDLYHFLVRQFLFLDEFSTFYEILYLNGEKTNYEISSEKKALINQDSLPEINKAGQKKYFEFMKTTNVQLFVSYNKVDKSTGHEEFRGRADELFKNKFLCFESNMRPGYWIEAWHG